MPKQNPFMTKSLGAGDEKSSAKSKLNYERANQAMESVDSDAWPRGENNKPMMRISMTASELIPTGQYANCVIGPAQITAFIDADRESGDSFFSDKEKENLAKAINELAEVVESDVVATQRNLVLEAMQTQLSTK